MKFLFFDTETNGLPVDYQASYTEVDKWPRVISLAWRLADIEGTLLREQYTLIKPDGWEIPAQEFWINNGYSTQDSLERGFPIRPALESFIEAKMEADVLVAHNLNFDHRILWAEIIRAGLQPRSGMHKICTMMSSTRHCNIRGRNGSPKWPKLEELHQVLFGKDFEGAHNAMSDVAACADCFFELVRLGVIRLPKKEELV